MHNYHAVCNSVKFTEKLKNIYHYYTLLVYLVVPIRREWQYLDLGLIGGNQLVNSYLWQLPGPCYYENGDY